MVPEILKAGRIGGEVDDEKADVVLGWNLVQAFCLGRGCSTVEICCFLTKGHHKALGRELKAPGRRFEKASQLTEHVYRQVIVLIRVY